MAFKAALEAHGYELVSGRRGYLILDTAGKEHSLARRIESMSAKQLNEFMRDVDLASLPTLEQAQARYQQRKIDQLEADRDTVRHEIAWYEGLDKAAIEKERIEGRFVAAADREPEKPAEEGRLYEPLIIGVGESFYIPDKPAGAIGEKTLRNAEADIRFDPKKEQDYSWTPSERQYRAAFRDALERNGVAFAIVTSEEAYRSYREAQFTKEIGRQSQVLEAGEIVVVTDRNLLYHRKGDWSPAERVHKIDQDQARDYLELLRFDTTKLRGIDETKQTLDGKREDRAAYWQDLRDESFFWQQYYGERTARNKSGDLKTALEVFARSSAAALDTVARGFDIVASIFDGIFPQNSRTGKSARPSFRARTGRLTRNTAVSLPNAPPTLRSSVRTSRSNRPRATGKGS